MRSTRQTMLLRTLAALLLCLTLSGCFIRPYRMDIQQGNYIEPAQLSKLKPEMTRSQVRYVLGTPLVVDPFHPDRWDYLYIERKRGRLVEYRRLTLYFDGDKLKRALTDIPAEPPAKTPAATAASR
jgi:outer membrane protein assembly factor BamE